MAQITVTLNVPPLTDNTVWFANAAAWNNYWSGGDFSADIQPATTISYGVVKAANTTIYAPVTIHPTNTYTTAFEPNGDGNFVNVTMPTIASYNELLAAHNALDAAVQQMRTAMLVAGLINTAQ